jgi:hypothetical protein
MGLPVSILAGIARRYASPPWIRSGVQTRAGPRWIGEWTQGRK